MKNSKRILTAGELARKVGGAVEGNGGVELTAVASIAEAGEGDLTFLSNPRYVSDAASTRASAIIVSGDRKENFPCTAIKVKNPDKAFAAAAALLGPEEPDVVPGVHETAVVADDAVFGEGVSIGPGCVIESGVRIEKRTVISARCFIGRETVIGEDCRVYPGVNIREHSKLGSRVIVHMGAVIGSDGFGYYREEGKWNKIPQTGIVEIGDDVEIGANSTIDRARFGKTVIGNGVKIDNLVQIAHNVRIGDNTAIAALAGIAGSSEVGRGVQIGGQAGVSGHIRIGDNAVVAAKSGATKDVPPGTCVLGFPAMERGKAGRMHAHMARLPKLKEKVAQLEAEVEKLRREKQE
ncbi:MAG: UDP-3-O-(3-hydroxymyristoyl)glucosamine N-acyltransferase [Kiritimatiellia bacterium]